MEQSNRPGEATSTRRLATLVALETAHILLWAFAFMTVVPPYASDDRYPYELSPGMVAVSMGIVIVAEMLPVGSTRAWRAGRAVLKAMMIGLLMTVVYLRVD